MKTNSTFFGKSIFVFFFFYLLGFSFSASAQNEPISSTTTSKIKSENWQLLLSNELVEVNYKYANCNLPSEGTHHENVYLQIKNKTNTPISCEWNTEYWYNNNCNGCNNDNIENRKMLVLEAQQTISGECLISSNPALIIFSKKLDFEIKSKLTNFNIRDLKVKPIAK